MNRPEFADELIALGQHLKLCPDLPGIYQVGGQSQYASDNECLTVYLSSRRGGELGLASWAATMTNVESYADRFNKNGVNGHVLGGIGGYKVDVYSSIPSDAFPVDLGRHSWRVRVLLQEA